jgi:ferritin-like metal-binding protein YciE
MEGTDMFEHFEDPKELFEYRLGSALTMEHDSLDMLHELESAAQSDEIKHLFAHHAQETEHQIANLEKCFFTLGVDSNDSPSPTTKGLAKEGTSLIRKTDPALVDGVVLSAALGTEHYEISAYETLVTSAEAMGASEVVALLKENLQQEQHTSEELNVAAKKVAATV